MKNVKRVAFALAIIFGCLVIFDLAFSLAATCPSQSPEQKPISTHSPQKQCKLSESVTYRSLAAVVHFIEYGEKFFIAAATLVIAAFTVVLAWATLGLQRAADQQRRDTRRSLIITASAARASRIAAAATKESVEEAQRAAARNEELRSMLERARIYGGGMRVMQIVPGTIGGNMVVPTNSFQIHINNLGRGPAMLRRIRWGFCSADKDKMPPQPDYNAGDISFVDSVAPGAQGQLTKVIEITNPTIVQALIVRFDYYDIFLQKDDWVSFIHQITPREQLPVPIEAPDGYVRFG